MKQKGLNENVAKRTGSDDEEQLDINELMDVQGGIQKEPLKNCGLGCYLSGIDGTKHDYETSEQNDKP